MNIEYLSEAEVDELIEELKYFADNINISIPLIGKYKLDKGAKASNSKIEYRFHIYRGLAQPSKYSLHLRFSDNHIHLVRICINGSHHRNYDGTRVGKNHIHVYKYVNEEDQIFDYAYELDNFPFDKEDKLVDAVNKFTKYINLKNRGEED